MSLNISRGTNLHLTIASDAAEQRPGYHHEHHYQNGKFALLGEDVKKQGGGGHSDDDEDNHLNHSLDQSFDDDDDDDEDDNISLITISTIHSVAQETHSSTVVEPVVPLEDRLLMKSLVKAAPRLLPLLRPQTTTEQHGSVNRNNDHSNANEQPNNSPDNNDDDIHQPSIKTMTPTEQVIKSNTEATNGTRGESFQTKKPVATTTPFASGIMSDETKDRSLDVILEDDSRARRTANRRDNPNTLDPSSAFLSTSLAVWGCVTLFGLIWALYDQSLFPLEVMGGGLTLVLVALPPLVLGDQSSLPPCTWYSSLCLFLYGIKTLGVQCGLEYPALFQELVVSRFESLWGTDSSSHHSVAWSLHHRRRHPFHGHAVPIETLVVYDMASTLWMLAWTAPHWATLVTHTQQRSRTKETQVQNKEGSTNNKRDSKDDDDEEQQGGAELLGLLVCLAGFCLQGLVLMPLWLTTDSTTASISSLLSKLASIHDELGLDDSSLMTLGECLFWIGLLILNLPALYQTQGTTNLQRGLVWSLVLAALVGTFVLDRTSPSSWTSPGGGVLDETVQAVDDDATSSWSVWGTNVVDAATRATFLRYNVVGEAQYHRTAVLRHFLEAALPHIATMHGPNLLMEANESKNNNKPWWQNMRRRPNPEQASR